MHYTTIYETFSDGKVHIITAIFRNEGLKFRLLNERTNDILPIGIRIQVVEEHRDRALLLLKENGLLRSRKLAETKVEGPNYWMFLLLTVVIVIVIGVVISLLARG